MLQPDPPEQRPSEASPPLAPEAGDPDAGLYLARLASTLAAHGGGESSAELALDLVLNEIVEQACLATTASGAAIALRRGDEMVCRATRGGHAPDLGAPLSTASGLSGACIRTRQWQRCDDTESDPRVDATVSRALEARSVLVLPILDGEELLGLFEIFSPRAGAFRERDQQTLEALSRRIVHCVRQAADVPAGEAPAAATPAAEAALQSPDADLDRLRGRLLEVEPVALPPPARRRDRWTDLLNAIVIALALLLGWMVGRVGWRQATGGPARVVSTAPQPRVVQPAPKAPTQEPVATPPEQNKSVPKRNRPTGLKTEVQPAAAEPPTDGLVVYERGKEIFRMTPGAAPALDGKAAGNDDVRLSLTPEIANTYLIQRVEPVYPEQARQDHLEGVVVVEAIVSQDGTVREAKVVSGDAQLAAAAVNAVRQWRFKPYLVNGSPVAFQTQISLSFAL